MIIRFPSLALCRRAGPIGIALTMLTVITSPASAHQTGVAHEDMNLISVAIPYLVFGVVAGLGTLGVLLYHWRAGDSPEEGDSKG